MGYESEEHLPLVLNSAALDQGLEYNSAMRDRPSASRERYLLVVILLQAVAIAAGVLFIVTRARPDNNRPLLYCE